MTDMRAYKTWLRKKTSKKMDEELMEGESGNGAWRKQGDKMLKS